jgi:hypothetical protein
MHFCIPGQRHDYCFLILQDGHSLLKGQLMELSNIKATNSQDQLKSPTGFEINRMTSGHFALEIWGRLPPTWIGALSSGLSRNRISVINGAAKKVKTSWQAEFEVMPAPLATDPNRIDFLELALKGHVAAPAVTISLDEFLLDDNPQKYDGALYLEVKAQDQLGFLGALLNRLAYFTLFPESLIIETVDDRIFDRFWIKGLGGQFPSAASVKTLRQKLESFLVNKR